MIERKDKAMLVHVDDTCVHVQCRKLKHVLVVLCVLHVNNVPVIGLNWHLFKGKGKHW